MHMFIYLCFVSYVFIFVCFCLHRCPVGQIRLSPDRSECVFDSDCFGVNTCLNGGTCIAAHPYSIYATESSCLCPPFYEGLRCEIITDQNYVITGGKDFVIIIIFALAILLSKFFLVLSIFFKTVCGMN